MLLQELALFLQQHFGLEPTAAMGIATSNVNFLEEVFGKSVILNLNFHIRSLLFTMQLCSSSLTHMCFLSFAGRDRSITIGPDWVKWLEGQTHPGNVKRLEDMQFFISFLVFKDIISHFAANLLLRDLVFTIGQIYLSDA